MGYFDKGLRRYFNTKTEKLNFMKENKMYNHWDNESEAHRDNRLCDMVNADRESKGLSPKTNEELKGVQ